MQMRKVQTRTATTSNGIRLSGKGCGAPASVRAIVRTRRDAAAESMLPKRTHTEQAPLRQLRNPRRRGQRAIARWRLTAGGRVSEQSRRRGVGLNAPRNSSSCGSGDGDGFGGARKQRDSRDLSGAAAST